MLQSTLLGLTLFLGTGLNIGCQSTPTRDFSKLETGMEKPEVLEIMGSPNRTQRWKGKDRWTYIWYDQRTREEKEVHFEDGKATYVGNRYLPSVSADQQDQLNEVTNAEVESSLKKNREQAARNLEDYENETKSSETDYVPTFEPVQ